MERSKETIVHKVNKSEYSVELLLTFVIILKWLCILDISLLLNISLLNIRLHLLEGLLDIDSILYLNGINHYNQFNDILYNLPTIHTILPYLPYHTYHNLPTYTNILRIWINEHNFMIHSKIIYLTLFLLV